MSVCFTGRSFSHYRSLFLSFSSLLNSICIDDFRVAGDECLLVEVGASHLGTLLFSSVWLWLEVWCYFLSRCFLNVTFDQPFYPPPLVFHFDLLSDFIPCCVFWALFQRFVLCPCKEMHRSVTVKASSYMNVHFYIRKWQRTKLPVIKAGVKTILHGKNKAEMGCLRQMKAVCLYFRLTTTIKTAFRAILPFLKLAISSFYVLVWLKCPYTRLKCIGLLNRWSDVSVF